MSLGLLGGVRQAPTTPQSPFPGFHLTCFRLQFSNVSIIGYDSNQFSSCIMKPSPFLQPAPYAPSAQPTECFARHLVKHLLCMTSFNLQQPCNGIHYNPHDTDKKTKVYSKWLVSWPDPHAQQVIVKTALTLNSELRRPLLHQLPCFFQPQYKSISSTGKHSTN